MQAQIGQTTHSWAQLCDCIRKAQRPFSQAVICAGSDRSDHTQLGVAVSCDADDLHEDEESESEQAPQAAADDYEIDTPEPYHSDNESGAGGVSSGVSISDCESPSLGLSAFDSPFQDDQARHMDRCGLLLHLQSCMCHFVVCTCHFVMCTFGFSDYLGLS